MLADLILIPLAIDEKERIKVVPGPAGMSIRLHRGNGENLLEKTVSSLNSLF